MTKNKGSSINNCEYDETTLEQAIAVEQQKLDDALKSLGKSYYEIHKSNAEPIFAQLIANVDEASTKLKEYSHTYAVLKNKIQCPQCGNFVKNTDLFCTRCGTKLSSDITKSQKSNQSFCRVCGHPAEYGASFCIKCGARLTDINNNRNKSTQ